MFTRNKQGQRVFAVVEARLDGRCERMMVKCGVKGVRIETLFKLVEHGVVTDLASLWTVSDRYDNIVAIPGMGESSADILCSAIDAKRAQGLWDWEILASVGIANVGRTLSREALKLATLDELLATAGGGGSEALASALHAAIGPERCRMVLEGLASYEADIRALMGVAVVRCTKEAATAASGDGRKYKVVVTGDLKNWERDEFKDYIELLGHKMVGSVSAKTDLLITNTPNSGTVKNKRAAELGVRIVTEAEAIELMGLTAPVRGVTASGGHAPSAEVVDLDDL